MLTLSPKNLSLPLLLLSLIAIFWLYMSGCGNDDQAEEDELKIEIAQLIEKLGAQDAMVRIYATVALSEIGEPAIPALAEALSSQDIGVRWNAATSFSLMGKRAKKGVPALTKALEDENSFVRTTAAGALGKIGTAEAKQALADFIPTLIDATNDQNLEIRISSVRALGEIGPLAEQAIPDLIQILNDPDLSIRKNSIVALGRIGPSAHSAVPKLIAVLNSEVRDDNQLHPLVLRALEGIGTLEAVTAVQEYQNKTP